MRYFFMILAMVFALTETMPAYADEIRPGYLEWTETATGQWTLTWKAPIKSRLQRTGEPIIPEFCDANGEAQQRFTETARIETTELSCGESLTGATLGLAGLNADDTDALVRIAPLGSPLQTAQLTFDAPEIVVAGPKATGNVAVTYFVLGVEHILLGFDHLLFVIALVLLLRAERSGSIWPIAKAVTAFTVAHTITLIGSTLGHMSLPSWPVEVTIALSIVFLAVEVIKSREDAPRVSERVPWLAAFLFGLLHGFGFAGALSEIGLPENDIAAALLTFNLGVEAGQLAIVAAAILGFAILKRFAEKRVPLVRKFTGYTIGIIASFWLIERLFGG